MVALGGLAVLLLAGFALQARIRVLGRLLLPASVIGGFIGLLGGPYVFNVVPTDVVSLWSGLPGVLINFVFAGLFLGVRVPNVSVLVRLGGPLFRFGAVTSLGQYVVAFVLAMVVLTPVFGVPDLFACVLEVGFAGGHGTAAAMAGVFSDLGFEAGGALGQMSATVGIVVGVVTGMALIQWGVRRGFTTQIGAEALEGAALSEQLASVIPADRRAPIGRATVRASILDPLTYHLAVVALGILLGWVALQGVRALHPSLSGFPLFPLAMLGGMLLQFLADRTGVAGTFDRGTFQRITGLALDLLVVAAIASLRLDLFLESVVPFTLLMIAGIAWTLFTFVWLAPRMLETHWFEQGIVMYGTQTGVTAVGLMLLHIVDPDNETPAAQAFAARAIVGSPLFGGGLVTATIPLLVQANGVLPVLGGSTALALLMVFWPRRRVRT